MNLNLQNQITLHTAENCVISDAIEAMTGHLVSPNCTSSPSANAGCAVTQNSNTTFGHGFNMQGGGAFVHLWDSQGIRVWFFPRGQIPQDITDGNPDPSTWGNPEANFPNNDSCNTAAGFHDHNIIIDTTLCGDWAGNAFSAPNSGCSGSCSDFVADPNNFKCEYPPRRLPALLHTANGTRSRAVGHRGHQGVPAGLGVLPSPALAAPLEGKPKAPISVFTAPTHSHGPGVHCARARHIHAGSTRYLVVALISFAGAGPVRRLDGGRPGQPRARAACLLLRRILSHEFIPLPRYGSVGLAECWESR